MAQNLVLPIRQFTGALPQSGIVIVNGNPTFIDGQIVRSPDSGPQEDQAEAMSRAAKD